MVARKARRVSRQLDAIEARRREIVAQLIELGLEQSDVARLLDISRQRVSQIVAALREDGRLPARTQPPADDD